MQSLTSIKQQFQPGMICPARGHLARPGDIFGGRGCGGAPGIQWVEVRHVQSSGTTHKE